MKLSVSVLGNDLWHTNHIIAELAVGLLSAGCAAAILSMHFAGSYWAFVAGTGGMCWSVDSSYA